MQCIPCVQLAHAVAPDVEYVPALQLRHTDDETAPTVVEYVPAGQLTHEPMNAKSGKYVPAPHTKGHGVVMQFVVNWHTWPAAAFKMLGEYDSASSLRQRATDQVMPHCSSGKNSVHSPAIMFSAGAEIKVR